MDETVLRYLVKKINKLGPILEFLCRSSATSFIIFFSVFLYWNCRCGLVDRVPGYRSRGLGSIPGATKISEK
jgi:hypothetical protein